MRAGDALDAFLLAEPVEMAAGAAIGIGDEDALEAFLPRLGDCFSHPRRDSVRRVVPDGGKAGEVDMVEPVGLTDGEDLARDRAATDDVNFFRLCTFYCARYFFHLDSIQ
ncbi:hypothetical protein D3C72_2231030 [compost metagenome]